jgi:MoxR-like ATPase
MTPMGFIQRLTECVRRTVVGQDKAVERILIALLTGGHLLFEGMPGLAKTLLVNSVAKAIDLAFKRVQCTVDLLPSDIIGGEVFDQGKCDFWVHKGPVFTNILLVDEINRATPKVQSALLEAMQEGRVTIGNTSCPLPVPFLVIATRNPIEQGGIFELPEAQLDRFMMRHIIDYPSLPEEERVVRNNLNLGIRRDEAGKGGVPRTLYHLVQESAAVVSGGDLADVMEQVSAIYVGDLFLRHVMEVVRRTRHWPDLAFGCGPRGSIDLVKAARARAHLHGRDHVRSEDLFDLAPDVLTHRMRLTYEAEADKKTVGGVLDAILHQILINAGGP